MSLLQSLGPVDKMSLTESYYTLLESHLPYLLNHPTTKTVVVPSQQAEKYTGDFHGLLDVLAIGKKYHYLVTKLNGMNCSTDYDGRRVEFVIPSPETISSFLATYGSRED